MSTKKKVEEAVEEVVPALERINERAAQLRMAAIYKNEELVEITVSPLYAPEFSRNQPIIYNGVRVDVPTDGRPYKVPYSFALEIRNRIAAADEKFKRQNRMADVQQNFERTPGELKLFR
jgi:hypothetical protein